jgi:hypothetical protein
MAAFAKVLPRLQCAVSYSPEARGIRRATWSFMLITNPQINRQSPTWLFQRFVTHPLILMKSAQTGCPNRRFTIVDAAAIIGLNVPVAGSGLSGPSTQAAKVRFAAFPDICLRGPGRPATPG